MQHTEKNIRIIRDKLSRIGIGEKKMDDETILASYGINKFGQLMRHSKSDPPRSIERYLLLIPNGVSSARKNLTYLRFPYCIIQLVYGIDSSFPEPGQVFIV